MLGKKRDLVHLKQFERCSRFVGGGRPPFWNNAKFQILMGLANLSDETHNHDFVMESWIRTKTHTFGPHDISNPQHLLCGQCRMCVRWRICYISNIWSDHHLGLEEYQIYFKKSILHRNSLMETIHHQHKILLFSSRKVCLKSKKCLVTLD